MLGNIMCGNAQFPAFPQPFVPDRLRSGAVENDRPDMEQPVEVSDGKSFVFGQDEDIDLCFFFCMKTSGQVFGQQQNPFVLDGNETVSPDSVVNSFSIGVESYFAPVGRVENNELVLVGVEFCLNDGEDEQQCEGFEGNQLSGSLVFQEQE